MMDSLDERVSDYFEQEDRLGWLKTIGYSSLLSMGLTNTMYVYFVQASEIIDYMWAGLSAAVTGVMGYILARHFKRSGEVRSLKRAHEKRLAGGLGYYNPFDQDEYSSSVEEAIV